MDWIIEKHYELLSTLFGFIYLYFSIKQNIWLWPIGIIASVYAVLVYFHSQLYAEMSLNIYYVIISIYGWFHWLIRKDNTQHNSIKISMLNIWEWLVYIVITLLLAFLIKYILIHIFPIWGLKSPSLPWFDSFITSASIVATWMLARKILDQWLWWIVIDAVSIGIYIYKELYILSVLFIVYTIMAFVGYRSWKKDMALQ